MERLSLGYDAELTDEGTEGALDTNEVKERDDDIDEDANEDLKNDEAKIELPGLKITDLAIKNIGNSHDWIVYVWMCIF